ncbi:MAG: MFS transporter [Verrucomicrobiota bacterium]
MATLSNLPRNVWLFIAFRICFNVRFYYPVFAILFLDYGLTIEQFAITNVVWAIAIVACEVPSGALADLIGRKRLLVMASMLMVVEMVLLIVLPLGNNTLVFAVILLNRVLSGIAEALASGADEALAYDSFTEAEREKRWPEVLAKLTRWQSIGFFFAMMFGALLYDAGWMNKLLSWSGFSCTSEDALRFPIYATLVTAILAFISTISMKELSSLCPSQRASVREAYQQIWNAAGWAFKMPIVVVIILFALLHDSIARLFYTLGSQYYRLIEYPEAVFGVIGSCIAVLGIITASLGKWLIGRFSLKWNMLVVTLAMLFGFLGLSFAIPYWGILFMIPLAIGFSLVSFFVSHYLNKEVDSKHRATVLSFKGLALNLGFGVLSLVYMILLEVLKRQDMTAEEDQVFAASLYGFLPLLLVAAGIFYSWAGKKVKK